jgi:hypothetical protein
VKKQLRCRRLPCRERNFTEIFLLLEVGDGESVDENCGFSLLANCKDLQLPAAAKREKPNFLSLAMGFS